MEEDWGGAGSVAMGLGSQGLGWRAQHSSAGAAASKEPPHTPAIPSVPWVSSGAPNHPAATALRGAAPASQRDGCAAL